MDGVVVDSEPLSMRTIAEMAAERGIQLEPALLHELTGVSLDRVWRSSGRAWPSRWRRRPGGRRARPRRAAPGPTTRGTCRGCGPPAAPTPGLERLIAGLRRRGCRWRWPHRPRLAEIDAVIGALGLGRRLRGVASGEEVARLQARARRLPARGRAAGRRTGRGGRDRGLGHRRRGRGRGRAGVRGGPHRPDPRARLRPGRADRHLARRAGRGRPGAAGRPGGAELFSARAGGTRRQ